jgi:type II secretory pathway pseudopilin PulG
MIELLIVVSILLIVLTMTVAVVNFNKDSERVVSAALQIQSFLNGARDRAIHAKEPRGVRFFVDSSNFRAVTAMAYIDPAEYWNDGTIRLERWDSDFDGNTDSNPVDIIGDGTPDEDATQIRVVAGADPGWWELKRRGLLFDGLRIRIPRGPAGTWYSINTRLIDTTAAKTEVQRLILDIPYADPGDTQVNRAVAYDSGGPVDYELELPPRILPMDPVKLPENTIIDLDASKLPVGWRPNFSVSSGGSGNLDYSQFIDLVFSPRGNVIGSASSAGVIHFYICDSDDSKLLKESLTLSLPDSAVPGGLPATWKYSTNGLDLPIAKVLTFNAAVRGVPMIPTNAIDTQAAPWLPGHDSALGEDPYLVRDRRIVTVFTQTGGTSTHAVNVALESAPDYDGIEDDPFLFAETGRTGR